MSYSVLISAYSHAVGHVRPGLSYLLVGQALALRRAGERRGIRVYVASTREEDTQGLWDQVRAAFKADEILLLQDETTSLTRAAADLLGRGQHLVAHVQGTRQLRALAGLKKEHPGRLAIVYTVQSFRNASWKRRPYSWLLSRMLRRHADYCIFLSPFAMGQFVNSGKLMRAGVEGLRGGGILPSGCDTGSGEKPTRQNALGPELVTALNDPDGFRFLYLAALKPGKGHEWLVEGVAEPLQRHRHASVILAGWGSEAIRDRVRRRAEEYGITDQVVMPGAIDRQLVPELLGQCHAGIVPSVSETFGHCILEPMVAGLPVVGTRKGAGQWLIMDYHTGIGVEYGDRRGMARAVEYLITHRDEAAAMGRNAAQAVRAVCDWDRIAESHFRLYESLVESGDRPCEQRAGHGG